MRATNVLLAIALSAFIAACAPESKSPPASQAASSGDAEARWFSHVEALANDGMRGRETGSPEHLKAADYVADHFKQAGLEPAGTAGYLQPVAFRSRRINEAQSSLALVTKGKAVPVTLGDEATFGMRIDPAPSVEAPLVFAGHGLQIPEVNHDDFAGLDVKGKVVVLISGSPSSVPGALSAHYQSAAERWSTLKRLGAIGTISIANPKSMDVPWERSSPNRLNPAMALADASLDDTAGQQVSIAFNPARAETLFEGSGHTFAEILKIADEGKALPHFPLARLGSREGGRGEPGRRVAERRRHRPGQRPEARGRVRRADRAPRSRRRGRADQRRRHLQRRHGQRLRHRDADRIRVGHRQGEAEALGGVRRGDGRGEGTARLALLLAEPHRAARGHRRQRQHGHVPAALSAEVADGARPRRVRSR